ncbi:MAG: cation:proton antiporter [Hyphomicrobium sp.]
MELLIAKIAAVGLAGIGSQWIAWRFRVPGIVLLALAGLIMGPATGFLIPERDFGQLFKPMVAVAVAIILFEGGFTLNFHEIRHTSTAVRRLVMIGAPLAWILNTAAGYYVAGLPFAAAIILGGVLVVTGPTVIMPLLRQSNLTPRPASLLRWEAIVNDPVGALFAVIAFETLLVAQSGGSLPDLIMHALAALLFALGLGIAAGRAVVWAFNGGHVPEYLKAPVLLVVVLGSYVASQEVLEESGLLTVTVLGITLANSNLTDLVEIRRFKETITTLLVAGVFVLLSANIDKSTIQALDWRAAAFVGVMLFVVRPVTILLATIGSGLTWQERVLTGWIAPRGVVAIAVTGFFAAKLTELYIDGSREMIGLAFAMVMTTVVLHGFSLGPLARWLGLAAAKRNGVVIVGGSAWSVGLALKLKDHGIPVLIVDNNWNELRDARAAGLTTHYGEILSETAEFAVDFGSYGTFIAATDNDAYNTLVINDYAFDFGRRNVFQLAPAPRKMGIAAEAAFTLGGRPLLASQSTLNAFARGGDKAGFTATRLTPKFDLSQLLASKDARWVPVLAIKPDKSILVAAADQEFAPSFDDIVIGH